LTQSEKAAAPLSSPPCPSRRRKPRTHGRREKQPLDGAAAVFSGGTSKEASREAEITGLYTRSRIFLLKVRAMNRAQRTAMIARGGADLSCGGYVLLGLARCGVYRRSATRMPKSWR
jgi:hypothetical protein